MANQIDTSVFRSPGVYTREVDINTFRPITKEDIMERLRHDPELLDEVVSELRKEKLQKIKDKM